MQDAIQALPEANRPQPGMPTRQVMAAIVVDRYERIGTHVAETCAAILCTRFDENID